MSVDMTKLYKPGEKVPSSGIYQVVHDPKHLEVHEVTCVFDSPFPPCNHCGAKVRFKAIRLAKHIKNHENFK